MQHNSFSWDCFWKTPIVGILRGMPLDKILELAPIYRESGYTTLEVTMNTSGVSEIIGTLAHDYPELNIGAGTVCTLDDLKKALEAGAQFIVTPVIDEAVISECVDRGIPVFPGAYTPTEIYRAWSMGAPAVKLFPATQLGPRYIKDVLAPLNDIKLLPTGGVSKTNIKSFFEAGAVGVGMGSSLFDKEMIRQSDLKGLARHFTELRKAIKN